MINSKNDLKMYMLADKTALDKHTAKPRFKHDVIWTYQILLRKCEYYHNCRHDVVGKIYGKLLRLRFISLGQKLGFSLPLNVFGKGLSIAHYGALVVNANAVIGDNCRIHEGVTIGASGEAYWGNQENAVPRIGNNVFIATGAKIIGNVKIADGVAIGANAVVVADIDEPNTTWAGVPARKVSDQGSSLYIKQ